MSGAFVKEEDDQWLHDIQPTLTALIHYLTRENNGVTVYEKRNFIIKETGKTAHEMSNGMTYSVGVDGKWFMMD